jgi:DNA polymerase III sliding clamp (beta) subunit (PCNA family)
MITVNRNDLVKVSNRCVMFVDKKPLLPALGSFRIDVSSDKIQITGSDQRSWITSSCSVASDKDYLFCIPAIRFNAILNVMSQTYTENENITIDVKEAKIVIKSGDSQHDLPLFDVNEYPTTKSVESNSVFTDKGRVVNSIFRNMTKLVGDDNDSKTQLEGIYIQYDSERQIIKMSGGNGSRFCLCSVYCPSPIDSGFEPALVHHAAVRHMEKIFEPHSEVSIRSNGRTVSISDHSTSIISRTIDEKFPDMWRLFNLSPKQANIKMSTVNLMQCINEARIHKSEMNMISSMIINDDNVKLEMVNNEEGSYSESYIKNVSGTFIPAKLGLHIDALKEAIEATNSISVELVYGSNNGKTSGVIFNAVECNDSGFETTVMLAVYKPSTTV